MRPPAGAPRFSGRLPESLAPSALAARLDAIGDLVDLNESNPTRCGFDTPRALTAALAGVDASVYVPEPLGLPEARAAVAAYAGGADARVTPEQVVLTASTSEAYAFLFKLLCDPGEAVAAPAPSYPLLDVLARLEAVDLRRYRLVWDGAWHVDAESLRAAVAHGARALIAVEPNNPTGSCLDAADGEAVVRLCQEHDLPLIVDAVFAPYRTGPVGWTWPADDLPLLVRLDGLSKAAGLPQLKLAWMVLEGRDAAPARQRLEWIADAFLSVGAPVQLAARQILELAPQARAPIADRVQRNRACLVTRLARHPEVSVLPAHGGWNAVLRLPRLRGDDELVLALAQRAGVRVHPGYFYDFADDGYLVVGLLLSEPVFDAAVARLAGALTDLLA